MATPRQPSGNQLPDGQVESIQGVGWNPSASIHRTGTTESLPGGSVTPRTPRVRCMAGMERAPEAVSESGSWVGGVTKICDPRVDGIIGVHDDPECSM